MNIGIITGSGFYKFPDLETGGTEKISTEFGDVEYQMAKRNGHQLIFIPRHGEGHRQLPNVINYRANITAFKKLEVTLILATSVMGILDKEIPLASLLLFDDLFFVDNRLPGGETCTLYQEAGDPSQGHYLFDRPFSFKGLEYAKRAAEKLNISCVSNLTHAHSGGPRFNSKHEIAFFKSTGSRSISQTVGPEVVLAGEAEIAFILLGFGVDYANGIKEDPTPVEVLNKNLAASRSVFSAVILEILNSIQVDENLFDNGFVYRFE